MIRTLTCIGCPMGCSIDVTLDDNGKFVSSTGWTCNVGKRYAEEEVTAPTRTVTALVRVQGRREPLSVKTSCPVPKAEIFPILDELRRTEAIPPIHIGDVIVPSIRNTSADILAAREIE